MPSSVEVLRKVSSISPDIKVIILSKDASLESAVEALRQRVYDYLLKPVDLDKLLRIVNQSEADTHPKSLSQVYDNVVVTRSSQNFEEKSIPQPRLHPQNRTVEWKDNLAYLNPSEYRLFEILFNQPGKVFTPLEMINSIYPFELNNDEAVLFLRPIISRLRKKLSKFRDGWGWIRNVHGTGYFYEGPREE
jgi:DNA-binding response OmpR family regulator